jgi:hypothetical protein
MIITKLADQISFLNQPLNKDFFLPVQNKILAVNKPIGGLWSSTYTPDGEYRSEWEEFNAIETEWDMKPSINIFNFKPNTRIFQVDSLEDLIELYNPKYESANMLPEEYRKFNLKYIPENLNFERLSEFFDVLYLTQKGQYDTRLTFKYNLYGWDMECCLIMNYDCIKTMNFDCIKTIK